MIARLTGTILEVGLTDLILDVHGVGYHVFVTTTSGFATDISVTLYTHLAIRENAHDLYGFTSKESLGMFHELIKLPKIGPKTALQILSQADVSLLKKSIASQDFVYLSKMSGMSKKTAEKVVVGLRDAFGETYIEGAGETHAGDNDVIDALMTLGYSQKDALVAVQSLPADVANTNERLKLALKKISN